MAKSKTPTHVLTFELMCEPHQIDCLNHRFDIAEHIYNQVLKYAMTSLEELKRYKKYKKLLKKRSALKKLEIGDLKINKKSSYTNQLKRNHEQLKQIQQKFGLTEFSLHDYVKKQQHLFKKNIDSLTAQKIATRVWKSVETNLYGKGKILHFKKKGQLRSVEGKNNTSGMNYKNGWFVWNNLLIKPKIRENDLFSNESLATSKIKFCRVIRQIVKGKTKFYLQLMMEGFPPPKRKKDGSFKQVKSPNERVGLDIGPSSLAVVSNKKCILTELAQGLESYDRQKRLLLRKLDRSRRATNPDHYNEDGTIKKGKKLKWHRSNNYMKTLFKLKDIERRRVAYRKQSHERLANEILTLGNDIYIETMNWKGLQKRSTKTEISEKTGKFKRKKRFGKSIGNHAPSSFVEILKRKLNYQGKTLNQVNTTTFKASQFNHVTGEYVKKELHERWNTIKRTKIQRDLYSAFLLMNSKKDLSHTDIELCNQTYEKFKKNHKKCLDELMNNKEIKRLSSFGLTKGSVLDKC